METTKSGWYYDDQINNVMTSVTLHANMWWDPKGGDKGTGGWTEWFNHAPVDGDSFVKLIGMKQKGTVYGYGITPIARSILTEDFSVSIANTWTDFGDDYLGNAWTNVKQVAPYVKNLSNSVDEFLNNNEKIDEENGFFSDLFKKVGKYIGKAVDFIKIPDAIKYLNYALVSQGTRFSYYGGTGFSFGNLGMRFTIFPKYENGKIITVVQQLENLFPYIIGKLLPFDIKVKVKKEGEYVEYSAKDILGEEYEDLLQWQAPPGGFESELENIDIIQKGTLKLKIGPHYCLTNLVCQDANFNFSKQMVKLPDNKGGNKISPLFCEVALTLKPATLYSDIMLKEFISGRGNYISSKDNIEIKNSNKKLSDEEKEKLPYNSEYSQNPYGESNNKCIEKQLNESLDKQKEAFEQLYSKHK